MTPDATHQAIPARRHIHLVLALALLFGGCGQTAFECSNTSQCIDESGAAGICQATRHCSFADSSCASGQRYAELSGDLSGLCVDEVGPSDLDVSYLGSVSTQALAVASLSIDLAALPTADGDHTRLLLLTLSSRTHESILDVNASSSTWQRLREQCSARVITGVAGWWTETNQNDTVSLSLSGDAAATIVMVSAFQVAKDSPSIRVIGSANTLGDNGDCAGTGTDSNTFAVSLAPRTGGGMVVLSLARRFVTATAEVGTITLDAAAVEGVANGDIAGLTLFELPPETIEDDVVSGSLLQAVDWAGLGLEIL